MASLTLARSRAMMIPAYTVVVARVPYDIAASGPGLGPETVLQEAVRRHYVRLGTTQGRFAEVVKVQRTSRTRFLVTTSRHEQLVVTVRRWSVKRVTR